MDRSIIIVLKGCQRFLHDSYREPNYLRVFRCKRNGDGRFSPTRTDEMESGSWSLRRAKERERESGRRAPENLGNEEEKQDFSV